MDKDRAEQVAKGINAVLTTYEAVVIPDSWKVPDAYCVAIYERNPQLGIICTFDDGEVLYEPQEADYVIEDWDHDSREWLVRTISAELYAELEAAAVGDEAGDGQ